MDPTHICEEMKVLQTTYQQVVLVKKPHFYSGGEPCWQKFVSTFNLLKKKWVPEVIGEKLEPPICPYCDKHLE